MPYLGARVGARMQDSLFNVVSEAVTTNDYYTPKWIFDAMSLEFDIDVAAPVQGIPWIPAKRWFSQADDGLTQDWGGALVWMNPPYSQTTPWVHKFIENNNGVTLLPITKTKWFWLLWQISDAVLMLPTQLKYVRPDESRADISPQSCLFALGDTATNALHNMNIGKVR